MKKCLSDIAWFHRRLLSGELTRSDAAVLDAHDAALLNSVICANNAAEPLSPEAKAVIEESGKLHMDMVQHMRFDHRN